MGIAGVCGDYPQFGTILNQSTHKSPHSELQHDTFHRLRFPVNKAMGIRQNIWLCLLGITMQQAYMLVLTKPATARLAPVTHH